MARCVFHLLAVACAVLPAVAQGPAPPALPEGPTPNWSLPDTPGFFFSADLAWVRPSFTPRIVGVDPKATLQLERAWMPTVTLGLAPSPLLFRFQALESEGAATLFPPAVPEASHVHARLAVQWLDWEFWNVGGARLSVTQVADSQGGFGLRVFASQSTTTSRQADLSQEQRENYLTAGPYLGGTARFGSPATGLSCFIGGELGLLAGLRRDAADFIKAKGAAAADRTSHGQLLGSARCEAGVAWARDWGAWSCRASAGYRFGIFRHFGESKTTEGYDYDEEIGLWVHRPESGQDRDGMRDLIYHGPFAAVEIRF